MNILIAGVSLWIGVHLVPSLARGLRQKLIDNLGGGPYRGLFALLIASSLVMIVSGWRSTPESYIYILPVWTRTAGFALMFMSFVLLGAAHGKSIINRYVRHPMLLAVFFWSVSHLLTNGTGRAWILFGGLGLWALLEMPLINARDGRRERPDAPALRVELIGLAISAVIFAVVIYLHPYFTGVSPLPLY